jgi:hypothetical protein
MELQRGSFCVVTADLFLNFVNSDTSVIPSIPHTFASVGSDEKSFLRRRGLSYLLGPGHVLFF